MCRPYARVRPPTTSGIVERTLRNRPAAAAVLAQRFFLYRVRRPGSCSTLKYAPHVLSPCPAAVAKSWQIRSAPARPFRLQVLLLALVTKKPMLGGGASAA